MMIPLVTSSPWPYRRVSLFVYLAIRQRKIHVFFFHSLHISTKKEVALIFCAIISALILFLPCQAKANNLDFLEISQCLERSLKKSVFVIFHTWCFLLAVLFSPLAYGHCQGLTLPLVRLVLSPSKVNAKIYIWFF